MHHVRAPSPSFGNLELGKPKILREMCDIHRLIFNILAKSRSLYPLLGILSTRVRVSGYEHEGSAEMWLKH